ncbi:hypothetical protein MTO96_032011 [Rhipicephalus appendiculatus]
MKTIEIEKRRCRSERGDSHHAEADDDGVVWSCSSDATKTWAEQDEDEPDKDDDKDDEKSSNFPHPMLEDKQSSMCKAKRTVQGNNSALSFLF